MFEPVLSQGGGDISVTPDGEKARIPSYVRYFTDLQCHDGHYVALEITVP